MGQIADRARRLLFVGLLVAVTAVSACQNGATKDRPSPAAASTSAAPSTNVDQNSAAVCTLAVTAMGGVASTAVPDARQLASGQLSREEFGERLRPIYKTAGARLRQLAPDALDPTLRAEIEGWAGQLDEGASAPDPVAFYTARYDTLFDEVRKTCKVG